MAKPDDMAILLHVSMDLPLRDAYELMRTESGIKAAMDIDMEITRFDSCKSSAADTTITSAGSKEDIEVILLNCIRKFELPDSVIEYCTIGEIIRMIGGKDTRKMLSIEETSKLHNIERCDCG